MNTKTTVISQEQLDNQFACCDKIAAYWQEKGITPIAYVETYGCQQNEADSEKLRGYLTQSGYAMGSEAEGADVVIMNTCAIREHAEQRVFGNLGALTHTKRRHPEQKIFLCGCMAGETKVSDRIKKSYPHVDGVFSTHHLWQFPEILWNVLSGKKRQFFITDEPGSIAEGIPQVRDSKLKAWVSIMYGCNNFCTYCIVPYVRGRERSRASSEIVEEVRGLIADGVHEITLLGQNVNSYRGDVDFATLLEKLAQLDGEFLLRFMTSHPKDVPDDLIRVMAQYPEHIAPHFHLPLQSGSDRILAAMNRRYTTERYLGIVDRLRAAMPDISLSTDIIVGFPGEDERDFAQTLDILRRVRFDTVYAFVYSPRKGTAAAELPGRISDEEKKDRMNRLLTLQGDISLACAKRFEGRVLRALVDGPAKSGESVYSARTAENRLVHFTSDRNFTGQYVTLHIDRADAFALYGSLV